MTERSPSNKLLLSEQGARFEPYQDPVTVPGKCGTLTVCLPSRHTGGEVQLLHDSERRTLETSSASASEISIMAWYSNVQNELRAVPSGYRLVRVYKLMQDPADPQQSAAASNGSGSMSMFTLESLFQAWTETYDSTKLLISPLQDQNVANTSLANLGTRDAVTGRLLKRISYKNGIYWFLTKLSLYKDGDEVEYNLENWKLPSGQQVELYYGEVGPVQLLADQWMFTPRSRSQFMIVLMRKDKALEGTSLALGDTIEDMTTMWSIL